jgi:hypothetical protein
MKKCHGNYLVIIRQLSHSNLATSTMKIIQQNIVTCDLVLKPQSRQTQWYKQIANCVNGLEDKLFFCI